MAKTVPAVTAPVEPDAAPATMVVAVLSAKTQKLIAAVTEPFKAYAGARIALGQTQAKLAPKFMAAFDAWHGETSGNFIDFVRIIDSSVPIQREAYRANGVYQAADYLRRVVALSEIAPREKRDPNAPKAVSPIEAVARLVATVAPLVENMDVLWEAFLKELHWSDRQVARVQKLVLKGAAPAILQQHGNKLKLVRRSA